MLLAVRVAAPAVGQAEVVRLAGAMASPVGDISGAGKRETAIVRYALYTLAGAILLLGLGGLALRGTVSFPAQARSWSLVLHMALAILGLGAFVVAAAQSLWFALRADNPAEALDPALPAQAQGMRGRPGDPGRAVCLAAFPLLTAAVILGSLWGLLASASPVRPVASEMWLLAAWFLGAAYFHASSGWRPLRISVWLAVLLVMAALLAGIAAVLAAPSLLTL
jgi:ABC-type transport system involved in cytochrome c biogenesis permease subunit